jgi:propionyl-CoA carboxylase alpha chain
VVGVEFDSMLAKVVAHAPSRAEAVGRLALALDRLHIGGLVTNRDFLVATLRSAAFAAGDTTTDFIERTDPPRFRERRDDELARVAVAAALWLQGSNRREAEALATLPSGWRNSRFPPERVELGIGHRSVVIHYRSRRDGTFAIGYDADNGTATLHRWTPDLIDIEWGGRRFAHRVSRSGADLHLTGGRGTVTLVVKPRFELRRADPVAGELVAPMPGVVLDVRIEPGEAVRRGQTLVVIEAMKMEHHINAGVDGIVSGVHVETGQQLDRGTPLLVIEPAALVEDESRADAGGPP